MASKGWHYRGYLPHFDKEIIQLVTFRPHDSVPSERLERWRDELDWKQGLAATSEQAVELRRRIERYEDAGHGCCWLARPIVASMVQGALRYYDGVRYGLVAWCVMPNHVHVLFRVVEGFGLSDVVHNWKSFTAHEANKLLRRKGVFWLNDYHDRYIRDDEHYRNAINYIHNNPVKAGLVATPEQWLYSSAYSISGD